MDTVYVCPTVNLDHSDSLSIEYDQAGGLTITFTSIDHFNTAKSSWVLESDLLFLTYAVDCKGSDEADFCVFRVTELTYTAELRCSAKVTVVEQQEVIATADVSFGTYYPSTAPPTSGSDSSDTGSAGFQTASDDAPTPLCSGLDPVYGLPMASLGVDFDAALDDCLRFQTLNETNYASYFGIESAGKTLSADSANIDDLTNTTQDGYYVLNDTLIGRRLARRSSGLDKRGVFSYDTAEIFRKGLPFSLPAKQPLPETPFKRADGTARPGRLLESFKKAGTNGNAELSIYCIECGASGNVEISGEIRYRAIPPSLEYVKIRANANINVGFAIGIVANAQYTKTITQPLGDFSLVGLSFAIVTIGPQINLGVDVTFNALATGQILAGANFGLQAATLDLNLGNPSQSSSNGWTPYFNPLLEASGNIELSTEVGLPIGISCGVTIRAFGQVGVGVVERPAVEAKASFSAEASLGGGAKITTTDGCKGISTQVSFKNTLKAEANFFSKKASKDLLQPYLKVLDKGCIPVGPQGGQQGGQQGQGSSVFGGIAAALKGEGLQAAAQQIAHAVGPAEPLTTSVAPLPSAAVPSTQQETVPQSGTFLGDVVGAAQEAQPLSDDLLAALASAATASATAGEAAAATTTPEQGMEAAAAAEAKRGLSHFQGRRFVPRDSDLQALARRQVEYADLTDNTAEVEATLDEEPTDYEQITSTIADYNTTDGVEFVSLIDVNSLLTIATCPDLNLYLEPLGQENALANFSCQNSFAGVAGNIATDALGRLLHYYTNTMDKLGVSRLRVATEELLPIGSEYVSLTPYFFDEISERYIMTPMDMRGEIFSTVACDFVATNIPSRLYAVKDVEAGIAMLQSPDLVHIVTGSPVAECYEFPIAVDFDGGEAFSDAYAVDEGDEGGESVNDTDF